jgi:hypothetical protein
MVTSQRHKDIVDGLNERIRELQDENAELIAERVFVGPVCQKAVDAFGKEREIVVAIEEMAELTQVLAKVVRGISDFDNVAEEIADVEICMEVMKRVFNNTDKVHDWKKTKVCRLQKRILKGCDHEGG